MDKPQYQNYLQQKFPLQTVSMGGINYTQSANGDLTPVAINSISRDAAKSKYGSTPAVRNFNPGNITDTSFGGKKVAGERFTVFDTPEQGFAALISKIEYNQNNSSSKYYNNTIEEYFQKYAPSSDGNNPQAYAKDVASKLGVTINTKISQVDASKMAAIIASHEDGNSFRMLKDLGIINADYSVNMGGGENSSNSKDSYLALLNKGGMTNSDKKDIADLAAKEGRSKEFQEALKQGSVVDLSPIQQTQYNKEYDRFLGNPVVKGFEEALSQFQALGYALSDQSGPGDMAGVFAFMKTLDPSSVVRESEFESAANSAGVGNKWSNIYQNMTKGKILTKSQSDDFKKIAQKFIETKGESYNRLYNNLGNSFTQFGISNELLPLKATDQLNLFIKGGAGATPPQNIQTNMNLIQSQYGFNSNMSVIPNNGFSKYLTSY